MAEQIVLFHKEVQDHLEKSNFKYKEAAQRSINERKLSRKAFLLQFIYESRGFHWVPILSFILRRSSHGQI